jgi:hypothetical protein
MKTAKTILPIIFVLCFFASESMILPLSAEARGGGGYKTSGRSSTKRTSSRSGPVTVRGHTTKRGTYVPPHRRTTPNKSKQDNWSTKNNVNPYTGKAGTKNPY